MSIEDDLLATSTAVLNLKEAFRQAFDDRGVVVDPEFRLGRYPELIADVGGPSPVITAVVWPGWTGPPDADETPADVLPASATNTENYASAEGDIVSAVFEADDGSGDWLLGDDADLTAVATLYGRIVVTDDAEPNVRVFNLGLVRPVPVLDSAAAISGDALVGASITLTDATYVGANAAPVVHHLRRDGTVIATDPDSPYVAVNADIGKALTYRATPSLGPVSTSSGSIAIPATTITQDAPPVIVEIEAGDDAVDAYDTPGSYSTNNGTTISGIAHQMRLGAPPGGSNIADSYEVEPEDEVYVRETVTASDGTQQVFVSVSTTVPVDEGDAALSFSYVDGELTIDTDGETFSVTLGSSTYGPFAVADAASGPIPIIPPSITGNGTLSRVPGFWAWDPDGGDPTIAVQWRRDESAISGETGDTYEIDQGDDANADIDLTETATQDGWGSPQSVASSNQISVPAAWVIDGYTILAAPYVAPPPPPVVSGYTVIG